MLSKSMGTSTISILPILLFNNTTGFSGGTGADAENAYLICSANQLNNVNNKFK